MRYDALAALEELKKACVGYKKTYIRDEKNDPSPRHQGVLGILNNIDPMIEFLGGVSEEEFSSITKTGNKNQTLLDVLSSRKLLSAQDPAVRAKVATQRMRHAHNSRLSRILGMLADTNSSLSDSRALYGRINGMLKSPVARNQKDLEEAKEQILGRYDQLLADIRRYIDDRKSGSLKKVYRIAQVREMAAILQKERAAVAKISVKTLAESGASEASWLQLMLGGETILQETMKDGKAVFEPDDGRIGYAHTTDEVHWKNHAANSALHFLGADMSAYRTYEVVKTQKLDGTQGKALMYRDRTVVVRSINDSLALQWRDANFLYKAATDLKLNIQYSETALKKLGHIQIIDAIFGKTKRSRNSLRYAAKTQIVRGEPTLMICDVLSLENNGFFPEDDAPEAVSDIVDEKGALSLPVYDRELADRLMSLSPEECIKRFEADGIVLNDKQKQGFRTRFLQIQNAFIKDRDDLENGWRNRLENYEEKRRKREIEEAEKQIKGFRLVGLGDKHPYIVEQQKIIDELSENKHLDPPEMYNYSYSYQKRTGGKLGLVIPEFFESIKRGDEVVEADEKTKNTNRFRRANAVREKVQKINALRQKTGFADSKRQSSKQQLLDMTEADQKDEAAFANKSEEFKEIVGLFAEYAQANVVGADGIAEGKNIYYARGSARYTGEVVDREAALLKNMLTKTRERLAKIPEDTADGALLAERMRLLEYLNRAETIAQGTLAIKADKDTVQKEVKDDRFVSIEYDDETNTVKKKEAYTWISKKDEPLFAHEPSPNDVVQGSLGNCYFLATMSAIAEQNPDFIKGMMKDNGDTVTVRFYENGKPLYVTVEKTVPAERADRAEETKSAFRYGRGSLWIQMLEKAFVASGLMKYVNEWDKVEDEIEDKKRFHKKTFTEELEKSNEVTYDTIASGSSRLLARLITGKDGTGKAFGDHHVVKDMYKPEGIILDEDEQEFLHLARNMKNDRSYTLTVGSSDSFYVGEGTGLREGASARGIYKHHAYTVLRIERVNDEDMVVLRNPWGAGSSEAVYNETTGAITFQETVSDRAGGTLVIPVPMMLRLFDTYSKINL